MFFLVHNEHKLQEIIHRRLNFPTSSKVWKMTWNAGFLPHFDYLQQAVALKVSEDDMKQLIRHGRGHCDSGKRGILVVLKKIDLLKLIAVQWHSLTTQSKQNRYLMEVCVYRVSYYSIQIKHKTH